MGVGRVGYFDFQVDDPFKVTNISRDPALDIGQPGTFDENGVMACSVIQVSPSLIYMYYVGFELGQKIRYRLLTGLAISTDGGTKFKRQSETPILERSKIFFRGGPFWFTTKAYLTCGTWQVVTGNLLAVNSCLDMKLIMQNRQTASIGRARVRRLSLSKTPMNMDSVGHTS